MKTSCMITVSLLALMATPAFAQDAAQISQGQATDAERASDTGEIVVTAQRREQRLQDVPIAVTAITGNALQERGVTQTTDLTAAVPGLTITRSVHQVAPYVRGIGSASTSLGNDPSVAVYVDGVYQSSPAGLLFSFNNIERVEVLRGPQGTLFGRNATGGLIQVVTGRPSRDFTARASVGYGNFDAISASGYVSGGNEAGAVDIGFIYNRQSDGWGRNLFTPAQAGPVFIDGVQVAVPPAQSSQAGTLTEYGLRSRGDFNLGDRTELTVSALYTYSASDQGMYRRALPGAILVNGFTFQGGFWDYNNDVSAISKSEVVQVSAQINHDAGFANIRSISAYYLADNSNRVPADGVPEVRDFQASFSSYTETYTQEFQLISPAGGNLDWILGAFYMDSFSIYDPIGLGLGNLVRTQDRYGQQSLQSMAGFAQATYEIVDGTRLTAGVRYTRDRLNASGYAVARRTTAFQVNGAISQRVAGEETTQSRVTWRAVLDQRLTPDILAYASINTGYKAGNFNIQALCIVGAADGSCAEIAPPTLPETLTSYEVGLKSTLFDRALTLNMSAFYYDYKNLQVQTVLNVNGIPANLVFNAAAAEVYGLEIEATARLSSRLRLGAAVSLLHTEYTSFPNAVVTVPRLVAPFANVTVTIPDAAGNKLNRAPELTINANIDYTLPTSIGDINFTASYYYNDGFFWEVGNRLREQPYHLVNAQLAWQATDNVRVRLWGRNLLNEQYYSFQQASNDGDQGAPAAPRTYGFAVDFQF